MIELKLKIHSVVDIITNSSTEIFSFANNTGIQNIKHLLENMIISLDSSVKYEDIIKHIYITPDDSDFELYFLCKYLKNKNTKTLHNIFKDDISENSNDVFVDVVLPVLNLIQGVQDKGEIEELIYKFNRHTDYALTRIFFRNIDFSKFLSLNSDYADYLYKEVKQFNEFHAEWPIPTTYKIIINNDKYNNLIDSIFNILNSSYYVSAIG